MARGVQRASTIVATRPTRLRAGEGGAPVVALAQPDPPTDIAAAWALGNGLLANLCAAGLPGLLSVQR